jgi:hypothetical protein
MAKDIKPMSGFFDRCCCVFRRSLCQLHQIFILFPVFDHDEPSVQQIVGRDAPVRVAYFDLVHGDAVALDSAFGIAAAVQYLGGFRKEIQDVLPFLHGLFAD